MNILFTTFQGDIAGSTNSMYYLSTALANRGHRVFMACRSESLIYEMLESSDVQEIPMYFKNKFDLTAAKKIKKIVDSHNIDLINSQSGRDRYAIIWSRLFYGNKCVHINTRRQRPRSDGGYLVSRFISINTEKIIAVSKSIKEALVKTGYPEDHIEVIYNGTPREKYGHPNPVKIDELKQDLGIDRSTPVIGSVSRRKNHDQLLWALNHLNIKVKLILVGIDNADDYQAIINSYKIPHEVHFTGTVSNEKALDYLRIFDIKILPSTIEGISQSILEAMALGVPVIATNASGNPELIKNGENGLLFEDGDIKGLADKINFLLDHPEKAKEFSEAGKDTALRRFSMENTVDNYEELFMSLLTKQKN